MRVGLDATPLLGPRTGVGRYVAGLVEAMTELPGGEPDEIVLVGFTWRRTAALGVQTGATADRRVRRRRRRLPMRPLQAAWAALPIGFSVAVLAEHHATADARVRIARVLQAERDDVELQHADLAFPAPHRPQHVVELDRPLTSALLLQDELAVDQEARAAGAATVLLLLISNAPERR